MITFKVVQYWNGLFSWYDAQARKCIFGLFILALRRFSMATGIIYRDYYYNTKFERASCGQIFRKPESTAGRRISHIIASQVLITIRFLGKPTNQCLAFLQSKTLIIALTCIELNLILDFLF